jgi:hypothetical protein
VQTLEKKRGGKGEKVVGFDTHDEPEEPVARLIQSCKDLINYNNSVECILASKDLRYSLRPGEIRTETELSSQKVGISEFPIRNQVSRMPVVVFLSLCLSASRKRGKFFLYRPLLL